MKKILKNQIIRNVLFFILGGVILGGIGITASNLSASNIKYIPLGGEETTLQLAIEDLYSKANNKLSSEELITNVNINGPLVTISYTGNYLSPNCLYGTNPDYGNIGNVNGNTCTFIGNGNTLYYYKLLTMDNNGKIYEKTDSLTIGNKGATGTTQNLPTGVKAIIYLNPKDLSVGCTADNVGTKTGCMKWYAYKLENGNYTMILDGVTSSSSKYYDGQASLQYLVNQGWAITPRLITVQEIVEIVGNTTWSENEISTFKFDENCMNNWNGICTRGENKFAWLLDYTAGCISYGCNISSNSERAYWTSTYAYYDDDFDDGYYINAYYCVMWGGINYCNAADEYAVIRPVIEVPTNIISMN